MPAAAEKPAIDEALDNQADDLFESKQTGQLRKMRFIATSLLGFMVLLYALSRILEQHIPIVKFVTAFSEAGIVGALADWFAVVALFKHPLGIPLWHTAIIPEKKKEISRTLAHFVVKNFLTRKVIGKKLDDYDLSGNAGALLIENTGVISSKAMDMIPSFFGLLNDKDIRNLLHEQVTIRLENVHLAPLAGDVLAMLTSQGRYHELFNEIIIMVQNIARENTKYIARTVKAELPLPRWGILDNVKNRIAAWLSDKISDKIKTTTEELQQDQSHELRKAFEKQLKKTISDLKSSPELAEKGEAILRNVLEHPVLKEYISGLWSDIKNLLIEDAKKPGSEIKKQFAGFINGFVNRVLQEEPFRARINGWIKEKILAWIEIYKGEVGGTIIKTVESWNNDEIVKKLELAVGRDLQYIRLNGTIVGGLAGLTLYSMYQLVLYCHSIWIK
jgi:uncharacterized membrane-anchored protein YjiN (DUF445 family)